jgi:hypothetical protein
MMVARHLNMSLASWLGISMRETLEAADVAAPPESKSPITPITLVSTPASPASVGTTHSIVSNGLGLLPNKLPYSRHVLLKKQLTVQDSSVPAPASITKHNRIALSHEMLDQSVVHLVGTVEEQKHARRRGSLDSSDP